MEGLNIESAASSPFHFFMQSEYSKAATCPLSYMRCTRFNFEDAKKHFRYFAPKYVVASSDMLKNALVQDGGFRHLKSFEYDLDVYELSEEIPLVEVPYYLPVLVVSDDWRQAIMSWWKKPDAIDVPLAVAKSSDETDMGRFAAVVGDGFNPEALARMETGAGCEVSYAVGNEFVDVNTSCPGKPHIVKVTYNPGWSVTGADKIYLAGPAFMLVYPAGNSFKLTYGLTPLGYLGYLMTFLGLVVCISYVLWSRGYLNDSRFSHGFSKFCTKLVDMEYSLLDVLSNLLRHWRKLLALAFAVLILHYLSGIYSTMQVECADLCSEMGYSGGSGSFSGIFSTGDHFDMGFDNVAENEGHELVCTAACDKSRGDFVYVNFGMISFNMASKPGVNHRLSFLVDDSHWCRTADIYFNGKYLDTLSQSDSKVGWNKRSYFIPKELITSASSNIILNHSRNDCWGVDVSDAWLEPIECSCS
ncbi:MAG: hypothetical protein KKD39_00335 [Candidatus Altiarchaeota archaeon]|nr:hypothetical protein [Candidatus Altiarchaeota archaeon]